MAPERRNDRRRPRHYQVRFWLDGQEQPGLGVTGDLSPHGAFIGTPSPVPVGSRLRVELSDRRRTLVVEAEVVHSRRLPQELWKVRQSGMGIQFLPLDELLGPLLGEVAVPAGRPASPGLPVPSSPYEGVYPVRFENAADFAATFHRDLIHGGLFVRTDRPAALHERVTIELHVPAPPGEEIRVFHLPGRVVQLLEPRGPASSGQVLGMGVELVDARAWLAQVEPILARLTAG